jgi:hypothetical protein
VVIYVGHIEYKDLTYVSHIEYTVGSSYGTHRFMPFSNKFPHMGHTERMRIPQICVSHIENVLGHYERLCGTHGEEFVIRLQDKIEEGLNNIE